VWCKLLYDQVEIFIEFLILIGEFTNQFSEKLYKVWYFFK